MITGGIYARVSSIGDRQNTERQVKDLSEYAKYKGFEVCKVFEEHISGAKKNDGVLCCVRQWNTAKQTALEFYLSANCQDWDAMRLRFLPLLRNSLTVVLTSTYKRNNLHYRTKKDIRPSLPR